MSTVIISGGGSMNTYTEACHSTPTSFTVKLAKNNKTKIRPLLNPISPTDTKERRNIGFKDSNPMMAETCKNKKIVLDDNVPITFEVEVPEHTPKNATIYVCGNATPLGRWRARGLPLKRIEAHRYRGTAVFKNGDEFCWKITRGHWSSVEKTASGNEIVNRDGIADKERIYKVKVASWADRGSEPEVEILEDESSPCRHVSKLGDFGKKTTTESRPVWVHVPADYDENGTKEYPVLYMLDGQNVFDPATAFLGRAWYADKVIDKLLKQQTAEPFFICAISHRIDRSYEYTPVPDYFFEGGGLHTLADLIQEEISPALQKRYRIRKGPESTGIMGSSLGGLASFHMAWRHPDRFGLAGVISPSLWWAGRHTLKMVSRSTKKASKVRFWIDMGGKESRYPKLLINSVRQLTNLLKGRGYNARCYIDKNGLHDEPSWHRRLHLPFQHLFPLPKTDDKA
jgi:predicted alpha/beta superfamily hydrolase